MSKERKKEIEKASWVGVFGNTILAVLKISVGIYSGSLALIGAGIDTVTDIITSFLTLFTARITEKPPDREHPYGHTRAETLATKTLSFIIFFAGAQLAFSAFNRLLGGESHEVPGVLAIYAAVVSILGKLFLFFYKRRIGKKVKSTMLIADAKNMGGDVIISSSVLIGLGFTFILKLPILDTITAFAVSLWIMKVAIDIFRETNTELMEGIDDQSVYKKVFDAVNSVPGAFNPHRTRVRKLNNMLVIDLDIEVEETLSIKDAHNIGVIVEEKIKRRLDNIYDVIIHIEPKGNIEKDEKYGLSEEGIKKD